MGQGKHIGFLNKPPERRQRTTGDHSHTNYIREDMPRAVCWSDFEINLSAQLYHTGREGIPRSKLSLPMNMLGWHQQSKDRRAEP